MKRKTVLLLSLLLLVFSFSQIAQAGQPPGNLQEAVALANKELNKEYFTPKNTAGKLISWIEVKGVSGIVVGSATYGILAWGNPHGDTKGDQSRYVGYTYEDEDYTNPGFPHDAWAGGYLEDRNWIYQPWQDDTLKFQFGVVKNPNFDGKDKYLPNIQKGLAAYYADVSRGGGSHYWNNWHEYVHILVPPTQYTWGMGRMWHKTASGSIWYISVPLAPGAMIEQPQPLPENNLKAVSLNLGIPPGQLAEPGTKYMATVVFKNESSQRLLSVPVAVLHGEYKATLIDEKGQTLPWASINGEEVQVTDFGPGESRKFRCYWHPFNQAKDGLTGIINRDEIGKVHQEITYEDNIISAETVVNFQDLSVQILDYPKEAYAGNPVTVKAKVFNSTGKMVVTKLVWKVNGKVVKEVPNFDIISEYDSAVTFDMPSSTAQVTVEVNPDRNAPPNEASWENNIANCSVNEIKKQLPAEDSRLKINIEAPASVNYKENFTFRVTVSAYVPPPPPLSNSNPPGVSVATTTSGGKLTWLYNYVDDSMQNHSFEERFNNGFTAQFGRWTTKTYTYTQRGCGIRGQEHDIIITATANMEGKTARDVKKVRVAAMPILPTTTQLTQ